MLAETLLDRGTDDDVAEAEATIERLAAAPADEGLLMRDMWLLRLRALLAQAQAMPWLRAMAESLGFEGHTATAEALIDGGE